MDFVNKLLQKHKRLVLGRAKEAAGVASSQAGEEKK